MAESTDFRYNTGAARVPWAAVGENYNAADLMEVIKFLMQGNGPEYEQAIEAVYEQVKKLDAISTPPGKLTTDKQVAEAEEVCNKYLGTDSSTFVTNCTAGFEIAYKYAGLKEGDEVIVPANTYIATAWGVSYTGATPVFVDCTADTWQLDPDKIEERITERTTGIIGVHLYGQPFDYAGVKKVADKHGLFIVEDCAQATGATFEGRNVGTLGELACFSFYPGKNLYAFGEGGSVTCDNEEYFKHMTRLKNQGCDRRYYHDEIGYNYRLEGLQGAVLSVSLKYLPQWTARRREIGERYHREITNPLITHQRHPVNTETVYHMFVITVPDHDDFVRYMEEHNVECNMH